MSHPPSHPVTPPRHADASTAASEDRRAIIPAEGEELPPPLVPADFDPKNGTKAAFDINEGLQLIHSGLTPEEFGAAILLQHLCWLQKPCGSLPNDDVEIANLIGADVPGWSLDSWLQVKTGALSDWQLCSDGRLYNPAIAKDVLAFPEWFGDCR